MEPAQPGAGRLARRAVPVSDDRLRRHDPAVAARRGPAPSRRRSARAVRTSPAIDAETNQAEAAAPARRAEANFTKARAAVDELLTQVSESQLLSVPGLQPLRRDLLRSALGLLPGLRPPARRRPGPQERAGRRPAPAGPRSSTTWAQDAQSAGPWTGDGPPRGGLRANRPDDRALQDGLAQSCFQLGIAQMPVRRGPPSRRAGHLSLGDAPRSRAGQYRLP